MTIVELNKLKSTILSILAIHEKHRGCYFWTPPSTASGRRAVEAKYSGEYHIDFGGDQYDIRQSVNCSARNYYYSLHVERNGVKKDLRALRRLLRDIEHEIGEVDGPVF